MATGEWGGYTQVAKGKWRIRYSADTGDGRGYTRHSETFRGGQRAVKRRLAELQTLCDTGAARTRVPTFDELWERDVLPTVKRTCAPNTIKSYLSAWSRVSERWGSTKLDAYTGADVQDWLQGVPRRTGRACLMVMRKVSNRALLLGMVQRDPLAASISVSDFSKRAKEKTELDLAPYFEAAAKGGSMLLAGIVLMAAGGCRVGEALAVRADSVHWDEEGCRATFEVTDQAIAEHGALAGRLKNAQSRRTASVPGAMGRMVADVAARSLEAGCTYVVDSGNGTPVSTTVFRNHWEACIKSAGLEHLTMRSLRRSCATSQLDAGADAGDVNLSMGHTRDSRVLFTNYDRPSQQAAPTLPDAWGNTLEIVSEWDILGRTN